jgi:cyclophilin family peptidyl-prolyl cis-trans isomerase
MVPGKRKWSLRPGRSRWSGRSRWRLGGTPLPGGFVLCILLAGVLPAQENDRQRYERLLDQWRSTYVETLKVWTEFRICEETEAETLRERYLELKTQGDQLREQTMLAAADCVQNAITPDPQLIEFLEGAPLRYFEEHRYGDSARVGRALLKHDSENLALLYNTVRSAFFDNQFEYASQLFDRWIELEGELPPELQPLRDACQPLADAWKREQELRDREALEDRLPRILFETTRGPVVVELFEDQAPDIVNNLIVLVENEENPFFVDQSFFFVLKHQLAVTGSRSDDGTEFLPVGIGTERQKQQARGLFRGSVGLDVQEIGGGQKAISTGCQFFQIPLPELADSALVIGRVIEGMEVIDQLQATHELNDDFETVPVEAVIPDRVIRVTVQRKPEGKVYKHIDMQAKQYQD